MFFNLLNTLGYLLLFIFMMALCGAVGFVVCVACEMTINKKGTEPKLVEDIDTDEGYVYGYCPQCGEYLSHLWNSKYCGDCGQPVGWKE